MGGAQAAERREVFAPEDLAQSFDGKEKAAPTRAPLRAIGTRASSRHYAVHVDMLGEGLAPGVEHGGDTEFSTQVVRVTGKLLEGLSGSLEQEVIEHAWVDTQERIEERRQGEDDVEGGHRQQECLLGL